MNVITPPLEEVYFTWLYDLVNDQDVYLGSNTYWRLLKTLHKIEFEPIIDHDRNRMNDGKAIRIEYFESVGEPIDYEWIEDIGCSMLELVIGIASRLEFQTKLSLKEAFWILMGNLGIDSISDGRFNTYSKRKIEQACYRINSRDYNKYGEGSLFPVYDSKYDMRDFDIWYQMSIYLQKHEYLLY